MGKFNEVLYAQTEDEADYKYQELLASFPQYENLILYLNDLNEMKSKWCLYARRELILRGNNTNTFM